MAAPTIVQVVTKDGGGAQESVTTDSFTPASGNLLVVGASSYAGSGDDTSTLSISDSLGLTWTKRRERSQGDDGAGINPPPVVIWTAVATGAAMTVTTSRAGGGVGFNHTITVHEVSGYNTGSPIADTAEQSTTNNMSLSLTTDVADCLLIGRMVDWLNTTVPPTADANSSTDYTIATATIQANWAGHRVVGAAGSYTIGTATPSSGTTTNAVAVAIRPAVAGSVTGEGTASLGVLTGVATGLRTVHGVATASFGTLTGTATGKRTVWGVGTASLGTMTATGSASGSGASTPSGGSWYQLLDIVREARQMEAEQRAQRPVACPEDGEPLSTGPRGELFCTFDGWRYRG